MISQVLAAGIIATTALSPSAKLSSPPDSSPSAQLDSSYTTEAIVRENATALWTINVDHVCPAEFPYVHQVGWGWTHAPHDNIIFWNVTYGDRPNTPATRIQGFVTNWDLKTRWVEVNLGCTSDVRKAMIVPSPR